ncbi:Broad-complex core protein isoform 6 [Amphibalanus amphitrite]|uniref:Broad-complex core protein isoform 6 n=1 Tax=Amphibalanus amphitrite TaxID=1232801 RepID=A0A6A4UXN1_AMPAM|nr:Broad-complex core protein isoform 6 [Amphibalanus amphitrite]
MRMMDSQKFCLKWDGFQSSVTSVFDHLRRDGELVDITLCCEGQRVKAHRMMLSACSPYFRDLLKDNPCQQMVFFLKDTSAEDLSAIIEFMYKGSVNVSQTQLASFIRTAEMLQIKGLSGDEEKTPAGHPTEGGQAIAEESIKVEKVDLTEEEDDDATLDSTLDYVADYEGGYRDGPDLSMADAAAIMGGGGGGGVAGPSQRPPDDGSQSDQRLHVCNVCGKSYKHRESLNHHRKKHEGLTTCFVCGKVCCIVAELRRHLELNHGLTQEEVRRFVPTKPKERIMQAPFRAAGMLQPTLGAAQGMMPMAAPSAAQFKPSVRAGRSLECNECGSVYSHLSSLLLHKKKHAGFTTCMLCGRVYGRVTILRNHLMKAHNMSKKDAREMSRGVPLSCDVCGRIYHHISSLALHRKVHQGLTRCPVCGKVSSKVANLRRHLERSHRMSAEDIGRIVPKSRHSVMATSRLSRL